MSYQFCAFSFGGGVQSTTILLKLIYEFEEIKALMRHVPNCVYFADTGAESQAVLNHTYRMQQLLEVEKKNNPQLPDFKIVRNGSILNVEKTRKSFSPILAAPYFIKKLDGKVAMMRRQCTSEFKIKPIQQAVRADNCIGYRKRGKKNSISQWIGISIDEAIRAKDNQAWAFVNTYPLLELGMSRKDCSDYNQALGYPAEKSGCIHCPYKSDWAYKAKYKPEEFLQAVEVERTVQQIAKESITAIPYLSRNCIPLDLQGFELGGESTIYSDEFANECSGHCGT